MVLCASDLAMFQDVSRCFKMFQDVSRCFKMFQASNGELRLTSSVLSTSQVPAVDAAEMLRKTPGLGGGRSPEGGGRRAGQMFPCDLR